MSYSENNQMFILLLDSVSELLKGTRFKICVHSLRSPSESATASDWEEYNKVKNKYTHSDCRVDYNGWGQKFAIVDPTVQKPAYDNWIKEGLITFTEDYEHYAHYVISRIAATRYDRIYCDSETQPEYEWFIKYDDVMEYVKTSLLSDLEAISAITKDLDALRQSIQKLSPLKYSKDEYYN